MYRHEENHKVTRIKVHVTENKKCITYSHFGPQMHIYKAIFKKLPNY